MVLLLLILLVVADIAVVVICVLSVFLCLSVCMCSSVVFSLCIILCLLCGCLLLFSFWSGFVSLFVVCSGLPFSFFLLQCLFGSMYYFVSLSDFIGLCFV